MGSFRAKIGVIIFSWTAGIMYATLFTMPYLLVARYHAADTVRLTEIHTCCGRTKINADMTSVRLRFRLPTVSTKE